MKTYFYFIAALLMLVTFNGSAHADPPTSEQEAKPAKTLLTLANYKSMTSTYSLVWVVSQDNATTAKKYIWIKNDDGYVVVSEPKNTPMLKLAFNLDNYNHAVQKKEN